MEAEKEYRKVTLATGFGSNVVGESGANAPKSTTSATAGSNGAINVSMRLFLWSSLLIRRLLNLALAVLIIRLSVPVVENLLSATQAMNTSFDVWRIVNTYGAFGSITRTRHEIILQGTNSSSADDKEAVWLDYEFPCKPGDINRRPCFISPYHFRLDWLMWFAAFQSYQNNPWLLHLVYKLLKNEDSALKLLASDGNPFPNKRMPPSYIRIWRYEYEYVNGTDATDRDAGWEKGRWWRRRFTNENVPALSVDNLSLAAYLQAHGWNHP